MNYRHWVFDLDGTLVESFPLYFASLKEIFSDFGFESDRTLDLHRARSIPAHKYFEFYLGPEKAPKAYKILEERSIRDAEKIQPFNGIMEVLETLQSKGGELAIWTGRDLLTAQILLEKTGLKKFFKNCVSGTCTDNHKPHPEGIKRIATGFNCKPETMIVVGDHEVDVLGGKSVGARTISVAWDVSEKSELSKSSDYHFEQVAKFKSWIESL